MDSKLKVTDVPEEASFYDLVAGDNVLEIPLFQRPYMWRESHFKALLQDISLIDEETNAAVFLGVIVSFSRGAGPGRPPTVSSESQLSTCASWLLLKWQHVQGNLIGHPISSAGSY